MTRLSVTLQAIKANAGRLTRQQVKTLRGQALAGDIDGAIKGLDFLNKPQEE